MDLQIKGKVAFVSGSTKGIGFAIAKQLLVEGAIVIINGRKDDDVIKAVERLKQDVAGAEVSGVAASFSEINEVDQLLSQLPEIDILINNVGIFEPKTFTDIIDAEWLRFFEVNVLSGVRLSRHIFPKMLAKNWGRIIFISSESAVNTPDEMIHYGTTKTAMHAVSRGLAELTRNTGVTVNTIMPGPTLSEGVFDFIKDLAASKGISVEQSEKEFFKEMRPTSLLQRFSDVKEIANMVTYISSPLASSTNGAALRVDGGVVKSIL
ncbi:MAG: SDR family oxidoreductase [Mucilaginibacter sp.]|uniref:SDR family NAD(P)-dependent oxidoreductase n=1 Tax=Mucilaginibacter sp. TaxID=1882438 RepID=UPI0031AC9816